ncbi:trans-sulfuration enzyme family protein [Sediminibacterium ginsengisoli]|uniref:Methionine-gamma-lyase n=1 Tax=Sediminibacterium ginsengisoli TaxID=413434 RepID=A0A1T4MYS9_9BACT|nr:aminotransferase class I/II-fold pyridoxal phosphate-dependent enzyme [Sediminibacterium ginsengisoli]SJZ72006.1 methionine-gamma-lyase [Sediminibacterium ginsengisoli]
MDQFSGISSVAMHATGHKNADDAHLTPIYATSTFTFDTAQQGMERFAGSDKTRIYSRWGNPSFTAAEETIAALEAFGLKDESGSPLKLKALLHSSGQAAMTTLFLANLKAGDTVLSHFSLYGGTHELLHRVMDATGVKTTIIDMRDLNLVADAISKDSSIRMIHIETPANPTIQCVDIEAVTKLAKEKGLIVSVDNTFASPYLQQPFKYGVDFVFHSTTKFLNGHGTAIGGVLIGKDLEKMQTSVWKWHVLLGGNSNAFDAFLLSLGMKTLELRMERHCANAMEVARFLEQHAAIAKVNYTGLTSHPDHALAAKQMRHPGAVMSYELKGGLEAGKKFIDKLQMCVRAISLGTVDTLVSHPASMSHFGIAREERIKYGITDGLIRMSVGIENLPDILNDLEQALKD